MDVKFVVEVNHDDLEFEIERNNEFEYEFSNLHIIDVSEDLKQELVVVPTTEQQVIVPDGDQVYDKVTVEPIQPPFVDVSDTTATPDDVLSGKFFYDATGTKQEGAIASDVETYLCRVVDWEGTILKEEWLPAGATFTMPADPTYEGLVFDGWSGPVDLVDNTVVVEDMDLIFGAMYHTASGLTEIDIELNEATGLTVNIGLGSKDWGDGTSNNDYDHTYTDYGKYTIKYDGRFSASTSSSVNVFGRGNNYYVKSIRFGTKLFAEIPTYAFHDCKELETILVSYGSTVGRLGMLANCSKLKCLVFPNTVTTIQTGFSNIGCTHIVIPNTITSINEVFRNTNVEYISININASLSSSYTYFFGENYLLKRAFIKINGIASSSAFYSCFKLEKVCIEIKTGASIASDFCAYCRNLKEFELKSNTLTSVKDVCNTCVILRKAILPDSIVTAGNLFSTCYALQEVHLPENLTIVNGNLFNQCQSLKSVTLPPRLEKITSTLLDTCYNFDFETLELPDTLTEVNNIGRVAYSNAIKFPQNLTKAGNGSLYLYSKAYGTVELPDSLQTMGAIDTWYNVEAVIMPASLTTIGDNYFGRDCPNIKLYDFSKCSVVPTLAYSASYTFKNINPLCKIVVPDALYDEWIVATNWVNFSQYIVKASEYKGE